jgi:hypothetical protein
MFMPKIMRMKDEIKRVNFRSSVAEPLSLNVFQVPMRSKRVIFSSVK